MFSKIQRWSAQQKALLVTISVQQIFTYACLSNMAAFFPLEASLKDVSETIVGLIFSCNALTSTVFSPVVGRFLIPAFGKRFILLSGIWLAGGATVLFGFLDEIEGTTEFIAMCFVVRIVEALGVSMFITAGFAFLAHAFRADIGFVMLLDSWTAHVIPNITWASWGWELGERTSFSEMGVGIGFLLGPTIGGVLYHAGGFKVPFFTLGIALLSTVPISMWIMPSSEEDTTSSHSSEGHASPPLPEGMEASAMISSEKSPGVDQVGSTSTAEQSTLMESKGRPRNRGRRGLTPEILFFVAYITVNAVTISFFETTLEPHLRPLGMDPRQVGLFFVISSFCYLTFGLLTGYLTDRFGHRQVTICAGGMALQAVAFILLGPSPFLGLENMIWLNAVTLGLTGVSFAFAVIPTFAIMFDRYGKYNTDERDRVDDILMYSTVSGIWQSAYSFGEFIGPALGGVMLEHIGYPLSATIFAGLCLFWSILLMATECSPCRYHGTPYRDVSSVISEEPTANAHHESDERTPLLVKGKIDGYDKENPLK